jgi:signal transduction histidine kinase
MTELRPRTILLVDDSPEDRFVIRRLLRESGEGHTLVEAETGDEGVQLARAVRPDCVLLDFHLPDIEGLDVLNDLRVARGGTLPLPVVMLTGQDDQATAVAALNGGAQDYVLKGTLNAHGLMRAVENAIEKFTIQRELEEKTAAIEARSRELEEKSEMLEHRNVELEGVRNVLQAKVMELAEATRAKDQFLAVMSHEMRTPLNAILGYTDLLEMGIGGELGPGQRPYIERVRVGSRHLLDLINDLLDLAKANARGLELDMRPVDLPVLVEEVVALLESQARMGGIELRAAPCVPQLPHVTADLQRLRQILTNLVGNAIKFTQQGSVTISCALGDDGMVRVSVIDTGIGIAPEALPLIFQEFYQADGELTRSRGGSGLGLAISYRLADLMGGGIEASSRVGEGSVFTLAIPAALPGSELRPGDVEASDARLLEIPQQRPPSEPRPPIAVVAYGEQREALAQLQRRVQPTLRLVYTTDAEEVPELARRERASLVVLDITSGGAAWNAAYALRDIPELAATAVLLLPSIPEETADEGSAGFDLGWVSLVPKPFTSQQLTRAVSTAASGEAEPAAEGGLAACDVLVVDDDPDSRRVASRFLVSEGVSVREAADGETALAEMRLKAPDVAVLDLMMPVLDGFGVLAAMRADPLLSGIPVVVLSAKSLTGAERKFLARTASRVVQKGEHRLADVAALVLRAASGSIRTQAR